MGYRLQCPQGETGCHPSYLREYGGESLLRWLNYYQNAQPYSHCDLCFSVDHVTSQCMEYDSPEAPIKRKVESQSQGHGRTPICKNWNRQSCTSSTCTFQHICLECHQRHKEKDCPVANWNPHGGQQRARDRPRDKWREREERQSFQKKGAPPQ